MARGEGEPGESNLPVSRNLERAIIAGITKSRDLTQSERELIQKIPAEKKAEFIKSRKCQDIFLAATLDALLLGTGIGKDSWTIVKELLRYGMASRDPRLSSSKMDPLAEYASGGALDVQPIIDVTAEPEPAPRAEA